MPINSPVILVVGGAGFIGSHMTLLLQEAGFVPIVLDNLQTGYVNAVLDAELIVGDMADTQLLKKIFANYQISAVMHFASFIEVGESVQNPLKYYNNNVAATINLLKIMLENQVKHFIFSSTAAVYGTPLYTPIDEAHPLQPINPYGRSKWMVEQIIQDLAKSDNLHYGILRYFNAAGAHPEGCLGERHQPESHLIPLILQVVLGQKESITIYGDDYPTLDQTCIRDYVHVMDLCQAHLLALQQLLAGETSIICNLGTGHGYSVLEVIETVRMITSSEISVQRGARRPGDPAVLVADCKYAARKLNWQPKYTDLQPMILHAWNYYRSSCINFS